MQFTTHQDIEAPIDYVFQRVTNFDAYTKQALRQGAQVARVDGEGPVQVGSAWDVAFTFRNKDRQVRATVTQLSAPDTLVVDTVASGLTSTTQVSLVALSPQTTRINVALELKAKSLSARLLLQSLKLAKSNLNARFDKRIAAQVKTVAEDYKRGA